MKNFDFKLNLTSLLLTIVIILLLIFGWKYHRSKVNNLNDKLLTEQKLTAALTDSVTTYKNEKNEWVSEKLTIQESIKRLEEINGQLTGFQKELLWRINKLAEKNDLIAAALIETNIKIDSLVHEGKTVVDTSKKEVLFSDYYQKDNKLMQYKFRVKNVMPSPLNSTPLLFMDSLFFPNKQFIEFHWKNDKKKGYPVSFSVTNTNGFYQTGNIDSYTIPEINKQILNPNGWQKVGNFFRKNGDRLLYIGVGVAIGGVGAYTLTR